MLSRKMDDENMIHCMEYCFQHFESLKDSNILDLWIMIALMGPGILYDDLKAIYCANKELEDQEIQNK
jgi:hypothetical protein